MIVNTIAQQGYVITAVTAPATVTGIVKDKDPIILLTVEKPGQYTFQAISNSIDIDQDDAIITQSKNFNAALGVQSSGGGSEYILPPATTTTLGGIIAGDGLTIDGDGLLAVNWPDIPANIVLSNQNNTFTGSNTHNGSEIFNGSISVNGIAIITTAPTSPQMPLRLGDSISNLFRRKISFNVDPSMSPAKMGDWINTAFGAKLGTDAQGTYTGMVFGGAAYDSRWKSQVTKITLFDQFGSYLIVNALTTANFTAPSINAITTATDPVFSNSGQFVFSANPSTLKVDCTSISSDGTSTVAEGIIEHTNVRGLLEIYLVGNSDNSVSLYLGSPRAYTNQGSYIQLPKLIGTVTMPDNFVAWYSIGFLANPDWQFGVRTPYINSVETIYGTDAASTFIQFA